MARTGWRCETRETQALDGINLRLGAGEFVSLIGQSGCGKSTLLSLVAGILQPSAGRISVDGVPVTGPSPRVGYMLQQDYLFEWRTILDNAVLGAQIQGRDLKQALHVAITMESCARVYVQALQLGEPVLLPPSAVAAGRRMYEAKYKLS